MSAALAASQNPESKWTVVSGAMQGSVRLMQVSNFVVGRSPDCEFVIVSDPKCSRRHARVQWTPQGYELTSLVDDNPVQVNGHDATRAILNDGDVLRFGQTEVQFNLTMAQAQVFQPQNLAVVYPGAGYAVPQAPRGQAAVRRPRHKKSAQSSPTKMVIYAVIALAVLFLFVSNPKKKAEGVKIRTEQQIQADIETAQKLEQAAMDSPIRKINDTPAGRQAQENFLRGFRDYEKGQFERSLESFQACLALDPSHELCARYLRLAQRRFQELIEYNIVLGRKYREQNQYSACASAFQNVMAMVRDINKPAYKEARVNHDACAAMMEGRY